MTILFFTRLFYPHIGGVEKHVFEISKILIQKGHRVTIVTEELITNILVYQYQGESAKRDKTLLGLKVFRIPIGKNERVKKFQIWWWLWKNRKLIKQADIIHCHDVFFWYLPFRFLFFKKSVYTTFHGYESFPVSKKAKFVRKLSEVLSFGNICIGEFIKKWYGTRPTYVSYGGVNINQKSIRQLADKNKRIIKSNSAVFIGRLDEQTGILTYLETVNLIKKKFPNFLFTVIGDGKLRNKIGDNFPVLGFKKDPRKYLIHHRFAFVSRYLSILEAMAEKRLVFAVYDNEIKKDYLFMSPFKNLIVIEKEPKKLSEKVLFYIKNPEEEKEIVEKAYNWVKRQTWENLANMYLELWQKKYFHLS